MWTAAPGLIAALLDREEIRLHVRSIGAFRIFEPDADAGAGPVEAAPLRWDA